STAACMVVKPTTRHGLKRPALEKQMVHGGSFLYWDVSTQVGSKACSHGLSAGPTGSASNSRSWRSNSSGSQNSDTLCAVAHGDTAPSSNAAVKANATNFLRSIRGSSFRVLPFPGRLAPAGCRRLVGPGRPAVRAPQLGCPRVLPPLSPGIPPLPEGAHGPAGGRP